MKAAFLWVALLALVSGEAAIAKARPAPRKAKNVYCNDRGDNCLTYDEIEALRKSLRDQDLSSRGRGSFHHW